MIQEVQQIRFGLPKGSLNDPDRGDTRQVLTDAGYVVRGYEYGKESAKRLSIVNDPEIKTFLGRPERSPGELSRRLLDIAITGADWVEEERINGGRRYGVRKIGDLDYGKVRLVIAVAEESGYESLSDFFKALNGRGRRRPILCSTEYVNLTARAFMQNEAYSELFGEKSPYIQYRGLTRGKNRCVQILGSDGATEASVAMGFDIIIDNSQSGQSLIDNRLREIGQIMVSSAGLYAGPNCRGWKERKAQEIFEQLQGAVEGKKNFDVKFNIPLSKVNKLRDYLISAGLCADEPTITKGQEFAAVNIVIPKNTWPTTRRTLKKVYSASAFIRNKVEQFIP